MLVTGAKPGPSETQQKISNFTETVFNNNNMSVMFMSFNIGKDV